ncbi:MAG: ATP-binding protein [Defluviitaleaceae bacterium]|nr:ATP-binding protein [Defluviitaleaceae bacterium]
MLKQQRDIVAPILIIIGISLVILAVISGITSYTAVYNESINTMRQQNRALVNRLEGWIDVKGTVVENNAMLLRDPDVSRDMVAAYFTAQMQTMDDIAAVYAGFPDGSLIFGGQWDVPQGWYSPVRPWYVAASQNPGEVVFIPPYTDILLGQLAFASARTISSYDPSLGVVALNVPLDTMAEHIALDNDFAYSFSFIVSHSGSILFHPDPDFAPLTDLAFQNIHIVDSGRYSQMFEAIADEGFYVGGGAVYVGSVLSATGWHVITRIPTSYIMGNVFATLLSITATVFFAMIALVGTWVVLRKNKQTMNREREATEMNEIFLGASPFAIDLWDENLNHVDCNRQTLELFGLSSKEEYLERFFELSPVYQPCGTLSDQKALGHIRGALEKGSDRFEFTHFTADGELLPTEVTLIRIKRQEKYMLVGYIVDLRPIKEAMKKEREADERAMLMLDATPLSCFMTRRIAAENGTVGFEAIDCNQAALDLFGFDTKAEAIARFYDLFPKSSEDVSVVDIVFDDASAAIEKGFHRFEFIHRRLDGMLIPCEITLVSVNYRGEQVLACYQRDLREIKSAMEREREASKMNKIIIDSAPFIINMWDDKFNLVDVSHQAANIFGLDDKQQYIDRFYELSPEFQPCGTASAQKIPENLKMAYEQGYARFEWMHCTIDGELLPYEIVLVRFTNRDKNMILAYCNDLRPIYSAMEKESQAYLWAQMFFEVSPILIEIWDEDLNMIDCNRQVLNLFEISGKGEYARRFPELSPKFQPCGTPSMEKSDALIEKAFKEGFSRSEWVHLMPDGRLLPVESNFVRLSRQDKYIVLVYSHDLSEVKAAAAKEREAEERSQILIDTSPVVCFLLDENRRAIDCNQAAIDLFVKEPYKQIVTTYPGWENLEHCLYDENCKQYQRCGRKDCHLRRFLIDNYRYTFPDYDRNKKAIENSMAQCCLEVLEVGIKKFEFSSVTLYGESIPCEITIVAVNYQKGHGFAVYLRDLREEKRREAAEEESRAKTRFLARMSHEVRTPMNAVMGITEIQLQKGGHTPETEEAFLRIYSSSRLLLTLINDILDLSKVEAGKIEIVPVLYETASLIADTVQLNLMYVGSKRIEFGLDIDHRLPAYFIGDELRIKQILNNILSNAFKYTSEGRVDMSLSAETAPGTDNAILVVSVSDSGDGMTGEQVDSLFNSEFIRFNLENNRGIEGSGLGMSIVHSLIKMMDGNIRIESEPGKGTTFTMYIPQKVSGSDILGMEMVESLRNLEDTSKYLKRASSMTHEPMPYGRVLVVDDVDSNLYVIKGLLFPYRLTVETVESGIEAIARIKEGQVYDIIFMDHMMPELDGVEATKIIRSMGYRNTIVALTANVVAGASQVFMNNGFSELIAKPIDPYKLDACLKRFIRDIQPPEVIEAALAQYSNQYEAEEEVKVLSERLVKAFLRDAERSLNVLKPLIKLREIDDRAFKIYTIQVHGMKSALANIGCSELSKVAAVLEQAGRNEDAEIVKAQTPHFLESVREIVRKLSSQEEAGASNVDEDLAFLRKQLLAISEACEAYNKKSVQSLLNTLKQKPLSKHTKALLDEIGKHLLLSDFEEAAVFAKQASHDIHMREDK